MENNGPDCKDNDCNDAPFPWIHIGQQALGRPPEILGFFRFSFHFWTSWHLHVPLSDLRVDDFSICFIRFQKFFVRAFADDFAAVQDNDHVG